MSTNTDRVPELYTDLKSYHSTRISNQLRWDTYYHQSEHIVDHLLQGAIKQFRSSLATDIVDAIADQVRTDEPEARFRKYADNDKARKHETIMVRLGLMILRHDREMGELDPFAQAVKDLGLRGEAVIKRLHIDQPAVPERQKYPDDQSYQADMDAHEGKMALFYPLLPARPIDPVNFFLPPNATWPYPYGLEYQRRRHVDMAKKYSEWVELVGAKGVRQPDGSYKKMSSKEIDNPNREVEWLEYWDPDECSYWADGHMVKTFPNPYGIVPYVHSYSGMGRVDANSSPEEKAVGIIGKLEGELESELVMKSIQFALAMQHVLPRILVPEGWQQRVAQGMGSGGIIPYPETDPRGAESIKWLPSPEINPAVAEFLARTEAAIARRVNPILRGLPTPATPQSGVHEALRIGQADKGVSDIFAAVNIMATRSLNLALKMLKAVEAKVNVVDATVQSEPEKARIARSSDGDFDHEGFEVVFKAHDPVEDTRLQQNGLTMLREKAITRRTFRTKFAGMIVEDAEEEEDQELIEAAQEAWIISPQFQQWAVAKFMQAEAEVANTNVMAAEGTAVPPPAAGPAAAPTPTAGREELALQLERMAGGTAPDASGLLAGARNGTAPVGGA